MTVRATLKPGRNLLAIAGKPSAAEPDKLFAALTSKGDLISVWSYDPDAGWECWPAMSEDRPPAPEGVPMADKPQELKSVQPGRAYYVTLKESVPKDGVAFSYEVSLVGKLRLTIRKGWNLIGFGGDQTLPFEDVFRDKWKQVADLQRLTPENKLEQRSPDNFGGSAPGQGYWVKANADVVLEPKLELVLPEDVIAQPQKIPNKAQPGDTDYNRNGIIDDALSQDTLYVGPLQSAATFLVRASGEGVLQFGLCADAWWRAPGGVAEAYPPVAAADLAKRDKNGWVSVGSTEAPRIVFVPAIATAPNVTAAPAVVSRDRAVALRIDRTGLTPGHYLVRLRVSSTGGERTVYVVVTVPTASGDYEGHASVRVLRRADELRRVGHPDDSLHVPTPNPNRDVLPPIEVSRIGLRVCLTESDGKPLLGIIDRDGSLVFPVDVPLVGVVTDPVRRRFVLSGSFALPPRREAEPGKTAPAGDNPFSQRVIRNVTLIGSESSPGHLVGQYSEVIEGLLPFPVVMAGPFELDRRAHLESPSRSGRKGGPIDVPQPWTASPTASKQVPGPFSLGGAVGSGPTGKAVAGADVILTGANAMVAATSDAIGKYSFPAVYPGVYRISANRSGFNTGSTSARLVEVSATGVVKALDAGDAPRNVTDLVLVPRPAAADTLSQIGNTSRWFQPGAGSSDAKLGEPARLQMVGGSVTGGGVTFGPRGRAESPAVFEVGPVVPARRDGK